MRAFLLLGSALLISTASAAPPKLGEKAQKAYATIKDAPEFCGTAVGYAGTTPPVVHAFRDLISDPQADAAFKSLLTEAKLPGQLYALCGLWFTDPAAFKVAAEPYRQSKKEVATYEGCEKSNQRVAEIVESKAPHVVRLKNNKQTIQDWSAAHKGELSFDIIGGAWPSVFKE